METETFINMVEKLANCKVDTATKDRIEKLWNYGHCSMTDKPWEVANVYKNVWVNYIDKSKPSYKATQIQMRSVPNNDYPYKNLKHPFVEWWIDILNDQ